jgi:hypothetical protein
MLMGTVIYSMGVSLDGFVSRVVYVRYRRV